MTLIQGKQIDKEVDLSVAQADHAELASALAIQDYVQSELSTIDLSTLQSKDSGAVNDNLAIFFSEQTVDSGVALTDIALLTDLPDITSKQDKDSGAVNDNIAIFLSEQTVDSGIAVADIALLTDLPDITNKQSKDTGAVNGNIAEFLSEETIDSGIDTADLVLYSDLHLANSIWSNPTSSSAVFQDFQVTSNSIVGRAGADIENIEVSTEQVVGRFLGNLTALDQTEVNDGQRSTMVDIQLLLMM